MFTISLARRGGGAPAGAACAGLALIAGSVLAMTTVARADPREQARAAILVESCASCHGPEGRSPGAIPSIAGSNAHDMADAMLAFRSDARPSTVMGRIARGFTDAEIAAIAAHFAAQP
jgi:sulfide dehydrogenase cytochrome subunit